MPPVWFRRIFYFRDDSSEIVFLLLKNKNENKNKTKTAYTNTTYRCVFQQFEKCLVELNSRNTYKTIHKPLRVLVNFLMSGYSPTGSASLTKC